MNSWRFRVFVVAVGPGAAVQDKRRLQYKTVSTSRLPNHDNRSNPSRCSKQRNQSGQTGGRRVDGVEKAAAARGCFGRAWRVGTALGCFGLSAFPNGTPLQYRVLRSRALMRCNQRSSVSCFLFLEVQGLTLLFPRYRYSHIYPDPVLTTTTCVSFRGMFRWQP